MKKNAILAPLGVLLGSLVFAGIGYGLLNAGMASMDVWVDDTGKALDSMFSGAQTQQVANTAQTQAATESTANTEAVATETPAENAPVEEVKEERPATYTTEEGYTGTVVNDHVNYSGETWISRTDSNGIPYTRASVFIAAYHDVFDIVDYGGGWYYVAQDGQPIYYDDATGN